MQIFHIHKTERGERMYIAMDFFLKTQWGKGMELALLLLFPWGGYNSLVDLPDYDLFLFHLSLLEGWKQ